MPGMKLDVQAIEDAGHASQTDEDLEWERAADAEGGDHVDVGAVKKPTGGTPTFREIAGMVLSSPKVMSIPP